MMPFFFKETFLLIKTLKKTLLNKPCFLAKQIKTDHTVAKSSPIYNMYKCLSLVMIMIFGF